MHGSEALNGYIIVWNLIAFGLLLFVIKYVLWPKLYYYIEKRRKKIDDMLKQYNSRNEEVAQLVERMKIESEKASERRNRFLDDARKESKRLREGIITKAYNEADAIVERAKVEIENEKRAAFDDVRRNVARIVLQSVQSILGNVIDEEMDKRIINETEKVVHLIE